jgi:hypothetical protein
VLNVVPSSQTVVAGSPATVYIQYSASTNVGDAWQYTVGVLWPPDHLYNQTAPGWLSDSYTYTAPGAYTVDVGVSAQDTSPNPAPYEQSNVSVSVNVVADPSQLPSMPTVQFSSANFSAPENAGPATITVNLSAASQQTVVLSYSTSAGTAKPGANYEDTSGTLVFPPGVTQQSFNVKVMDDGVYAVNKTVSLTLSSPVNATLGNPSTAVLTIQNTDAPPTVQFRNSPSDPRAIVMENASSITLQVVLNCSSEYTTTVTYNTADVTAKAGTNYTAAVNQQLTFSPGITVQTITITILNDGIVGPNTYFTVSLSAPSNASLGAPSTLNVYIVDSACTVSVATSTTNAQEAANTGQFTLTRTGDTSADLSVDYVMTSNGANLGTAGTPPYALSGADTIPAGSASTVVTIPTIDDNVLEGTQTLTMTLPGGMYQPGSPAAASFTVVDTAFWYRNANPGGSIPNLKYKESTYLNGDSPCFNISPYYIFTLQSDGCEDCWFVASASALAYRPGRARLINNLIQDQENGQYIVSFPNIGSTQIAGQVGQSEMNLYGRSNGLWLPIIEKGFCNVWAMEVYQQTGRMPPDPYDSYLNTGRLDIGVASRWLTGNSDSLYSLLLNSNSSIRGYLSAGVQNNKVMVAGSSSLVGNGISNNGMLAPHVYSVLDYRDSSDPDHPDQLLLRNPWGRQEWGQTDPKANPPDGTNDGIFWMPFVNFNACFMGLSVED